MKVIRISDPKAFAELATPLLAADEARHNLHLAISGVLVDHPEVYTEFHLWIVDEGGAPVLAALLTPPFNVTYCRPLADGAVEALAKHIHDEGVVVPGVVAAVPEVEAFVDAWCSVSGASARHHMSQRIYRLTIVRPVTGVPGRMRQITQADRDLLIGWSTAFISEALGEDEPAEAERSVDRRLAGGFDDTGLFLWEDGEPVCMVGYGGPTPNGARIGPV